GVEVHSVTTWTSEERAAAEQAYQAVRQWITVAAQALGQQDDDARQRIATAAGLAGVRATQSAGELARLPATLPADDAEAARAVEAAYLAQEQWRRADSAIMERTPREDLAALDAAGWAQARQGIRSIQWM